MQEINKRAACYIKGEESNTKKWIRDAKEKEYASRGSKGQDNRQQRHWPQTETQWQGHHKKPYYPRQEYGDIGYPQARQYTPLNDTKVHVLEEIMATG
ncbi:hypothetical protein A2U01_0064370, partial [Trifolium medium]|nr:hypothetical protein [Trifolium medium]